MDLEQKTLPAGRAAAMAQANQGFGRVIGDIEHLSLTALLSYVADRLQTDQAAMIRDILDRFHVESLAMLPSAEFESAVAYLVDRLPEDVSAVS